MSAKGLFYFRDNIHNMNFTLDKTHTTAVYTSTVKEICEKNYQAKREAAN